MRTGTDFIHLCDERIGGLDLSGNSMSGTIDVLSTYDLRSEYLMSTEHHNLNQLSYQPLTTFTGLAIDGNEFQGPVPDELWNSKRMEREFFLFKVLISTIHCSKD